jgi:hypothetical protein
MIMKFINLLVLVLILGCQPKPAPVVDNGLNANTGTPSLNPTPEEQKLFNQEFQNQTNALASQSSISPTSSGAVLGSPDSQPSWIAPAATGAAVLTVGAILYAVMNKKPKVVEDGVAVNDNLTGKIISTGARGGLSLFSDPARAIQYSVEAAIAVAPAIAQNVSKAAKATGRNLSWAKGKLGVSLRKVEAAFNASGTVRGQFAGIERTYLTKPIRDGSVYQFKQKLLPEDIKNFFVYRDGLQNEIGALILKKNNKTIELDEENTLNVLNQLFNSIAHLKPSTP